MRLELGSNRLKTTTEPLQLTTSMAAKLCLDPDHRLLGD